MSFSESVPVRRGEKSIRGMKESVDVGASSGSVAEGAMLSGSVVDHPLRIRSNHLVSEPQLSR